jgi:hypothetical protein
MNRLQVKQNIFAKIVARQSFVKTKQNQIRVRLGVIESDIIERPVAHIFVTSKANWEDIEGNIPQYETYQANR